MREAEEKLLSLTGYKINIVEEAGKNLEDLLHRADHWQGRDCRRERCLLCVTKSKTGKNLTQDCTRRSLCYKMWFMKCEKDEEKRKLRMRK